MFKSDDSKEEEDDNRKAIFCLFVLVVKCYCTSTEVWGWNPTVIYLIRMTALKLYVVIHLLQTGLITTIIWEAPFSRKTCKFNSKYNFLKINYIILMQGFLFWGSHIPEITSKIVHIHNIFLGRMSTLWIKFSGSPDPTMCKFWISREPGEY